MNDTTEASAARLDAMVDSAGSPHLAARGTVGSDRPDWGYGFVSSPVGEWMVCGESGVVTGVHLSGHERSPRPQAHWVRDDARLEDARRQLEEYFAGVRAAFDVPIDLRGTAFQRRVWHALLAVPYGETAAYRDIADLIGSPTAARAVGAANGRNPISIIVPCHRVIGADGTLTGYGWGEACKAWLLDHERRHVATGCG